RIHEALDVRLWSGSRQPRRAARRRYAALGNGVHGWRPRRTLGTRRRVRHRVEGGRLMGRRALGLVFAALALVAFAQGAWAATAADQVRSAIDRVLATVDNPALKGDGEIVERRAAVRKIANEIFDFSEIARRSLGRHWLPLSEAQRAEFVGLFGD